MNRTGSIPTEILIKCKPKMVKQCRMCFNYKPFLSPTYYKILNAIHIVYGMYRWFYVGKPISSCILDAPGF